MDYTGNLGSAGSSWAADLFSQPNSATEPASQSTGVFSGLPDSLGGVLNTAGNWLNSYLDYQNKKDLLKYKSQLAQQQAVLNSVETNQRTGATPLAINPYFATTQAGLGITGNNPLYLLAALGLAIYIALKS